MNLEKIIKEKQVTIVDVRTYGEFMGGNVAGSINIPLNEIQERIEEIKKDLERKTRNSAKNNQKRKRNN